MEGRTHNILIGVIVLFAVMGAGAALILPYLAPEAPQGGPGVAEHARGRRLMIEGKFNEAQEVFLQVMQQHRGTPAADRAQADKEYGIPYHQALRMAEVGQRPQALALLNRVARDGGRTEWGPKATEELNRLGQGGVVAAAPSGGGPPAAGAPSPVAPEARREEARQSRLNQANGLLDQGRPEEARRIFESLVQEGGEDSVATAARLALTTLQAAEAAVRNNPEVARARLALHRARASLLAYRGANGRYPPTLQDRGLDQFGFSYQDLLGDVQRVESYQPEEGVRFELTAVARDARGTRVRATDRAVEDLP